MRNINVAKNAGFCFGVQRAADRLTQVLRGAYGSGTRVFTLGELIHNPVYLERLRAQGVVSVSANMAEALAASATKDSPVILLIRTHGIRKG